MSDVLRNQAPLPHGFHFEYDAAISDREIGMVIADQWPDYEFHGTGKDEIVVGARDLSGRLVGVGTVIKNMRMEYEDEEDHVDAPTLMAATLANFVVMKAVRGQGIGRAVICERVRLADERGFDVLTIAGLESTNTLRSYYLTLGFVPTTYGGLRRLRADVLQKI